MNKKILGIMLVIFILFIVIFYVTSVNTNRDTNLTDHDENTFVIGFSTYPPLAYENDAGEYTGFELALAEEIGKRNGWNVTVKKIDWVEKDKELESGKIDCFVGGFTTNNREKQYEWLKPYLNVPQVCMVKSDSDINSINDFRNKKIETEMNTTLAAFLDETNVKMGGSLIINELTSYDLILKNLNENVSDAVIVDQLCAQYYIRNSTEYRTFSIFSEPYSMAFKLGNTGRRDKVQQTLDQMYADGTVEEIAQKYADYGVPEMININTTVQQ